MNNLDAERVDRELAKGGLSRYKLRAPTWRGPWIAEPFDRSASTSALSPAGGNGKGGRPRSSTGDARALSQSAGAALATAAAAAAAAKEREDNAQISVPQFYPTREGMVEDIMSIDHVQKGFVSKPVVQTETFSAHQMMFEKLKGDKGDCILPNLSALIAAVKGKSKERLPTIAPHSFRLPQRVTLTDQKREAWTNEFVNPDVPISRLARSVPHGIKGIKLLELFQGKKVDLQRALWLVRAVGAIEIQSQRNRPNFALQYTREWTATVCEFIKKMLAEITLPTSHVNVRPGMTVKYKGKNVMVDSDTRKEWVGRFEYLRRLVDLLFDEHLLERQSFLQFLAEQVETSHMGQLPFSLFLMEQYLGHCVQDEHLSSRLAAACFARLQESATLAQSKSGQETEEGLRSLVCRLFIATPDSFAPSSIWRKEGLHLRRLLLAGKQPDDLSFTDRLILNTLDDLQARNDALSEASFDADSPELVELETIRILDDIAFPCDIAVVHRQLFHKRRRKRPLDEELSTIFTWSVTPHRYGDHRIHAVASILQHELSDPASIFSSSGDDFIAAFIRWVDAGKPWSPSLLRKIALLLSEFVRLGIASYSLYLQRMIARGETEDMGSTEEAERSPHVTLLATTPLVEGSQALGARRQILMNCQTGYASKVQQLESDLRREYDAVVPSTGGGIDYDLGGGATRVAGLFDILGQLAGMGGHLDFTREYIPSSVTTLIALAPMKVGSGAESLSVIFRILRSTRDYWAFSQLLVQLFHAQLPADWVEPILDAFESHVLVWTSLGALPQLSSAMLILYDSLKGRTALRRIERSLKQIAAVTPISPAIDMHTSTKLSQLVSSVPSSVRHLQQLPESFTELQELIADDSIEQIRRLGTTIWFRYSAFEGWGLLLFEGAIQLLGSLPLSSVCQLLREFNDRLVDGIEGVLERWADSPILQDPTSLLVSVQGERIINLLAELVLSGLVRAPSVLAIALRIWNKLQRNLASGHDTSVIIALRGVTRLTSMIVGRDSGDKLEAYSTVTQVVEQERALARTGTLFEGEALKDVCRCLTRLVIQQEALPSSSSSLAEQLSQESQAVFAHIGQLTAFRRAVSRMPDVVAAAILEVPQQAEDLYRSYKPRLLATLLATLHDGEDGRSPNPMSAQDWDRFLSTLTVWRLDVAKVEVEASLERLEIDDTITKEDKTRALHTLSQHLLDRVCTGDGHPYLGEQIVQCYGPEAVDELVSLSFYRIAECLSGLGEARRARRATHITTLRCIGRILDTLPPTARGIPRADSLEKLCLAAEEVLRSMLEDTERLEKVVVLHLAHLVGFAASSQPRSGDAVTRKTFHRLADLQAKVALVILVDNPLETRLATVMLDVSAQLLLLSDSASRSSGSSETGEDIGTFLSPDLPDQIYQRVTALFDLKAASEQWSWSQLEVADQPAARATLSNSTAINLLSLGAVVTDVVPAFTALDATTLPFAEKARVRGQQGNFDSETPTASLSLAARNFRRMLAATTASAPARRPQQRPSAPAHTKSHPGPAPTAATTAEASSSKAEPIVIEDDDDEDVPLSKKAKGKARAAPANKASAKKRKVT